MSSYLNRLARRGVTSDSQMLQPFVRSTSPIAERDRRIGMAGFEKVEFGVAPSAELDSDIGMERGEMARVPMSPRITAASNPGKAMVRRKIADTAADLTPPAAASSKTIEGNARPAREKTIVQNNVLPLPTSEQLVPSNIDTNPTEREDLPQTFIESPSQKDRQLYSPNSQPFLRQTPEISQASGIVETHQIADSVPSAQKRAIALETHNAMPSAVPNDDTPSVIPDSNFSSKDTAPSAEPNEVRPRLLRHVGEVDTPSLEPATTAPIDSSESLFEVMPFSKSNETGSPQVVIGRIDVEVLPPPAAAPVASSRSGPLTAASVSAIGPLRGQIRSNVRFSLRQR